MGDKNINIQISSSSIIKVIFWLVLFAGLYYLKDLVLVVLTAVVIASAIDPAVKWFGRFRVSRVPAVILVYFLVATVFIGIFISLSRCYLTSFQNWRTSSRNI